MTEKKGFRKETLIAAVVVSAWLCVTLVLLGVFKIHHAWPALLTLLCFFERKGDVKNLGNIFAGAAAGLVLAGVTPWLAGYFSRFIGVHAAMIAVVFTMVFIIIILSDVAHLVFNNYAFFYFTIALIFGREQLTIQWLTVLAAGGVFFTGGVLVFAKILGISTETE